MATRSSRRAPRPLDQSQLDELALRYVARFATTRSKLEQYLVRKLRDRGWAGERPADAAAIADRLARLGYVDDRQYALAKAGSLGARGFGKRRLAQTLQAAGVGDDDRADAYDRADRDALDSALRFARRRRIGPFAELPDSHPRARGKALAAMVRAGHAFDLSRAIVELAPGADVEQSGLIERFSHTGE